MTPSLDLEEPFLPRDSTVQSPRSNGSTSSTWNKTVAAVISIFAHPHAHLLFSVFALLLLGNFSYFLLEVPIVRLIERGVCREYYASNSVSIVLRSGDIDESLCKLAPIQNILAKIMGWKISFDAVPGLLTAIYFGSVADVIGRKRVLLLSFTGSVLSLFWIIGVCYFNTSSTKLVWGSAVFLFIGGGQRVLISMIYIMLADTVELSQRTRYMYYMASTEHLTSLTAPPLGAWLLARSIWAPFQLAIALALLCYITIWTTPETLPPSTPSYILLPPPSPSPSILRSYEIDQSPPSPASTPPPSPSRIPPTTTSNTRTEASSLFLIPDLRLCFLLFFIKRIAMMSDYFWYQYASERFHWALRQTAWLRVSQAVGASFVTAGVLPFLTAYLLRRGTRAQSLDLRVVKVSLVFHVAGFFGVWAAGGPVGLGIAIAIDGAGQGLEPALQGLASSLVDKTRNARTFTTIAVLDTVAQIVGGPLTAGLFSIGRSEVKGSSGVCFLVSSCLFALMFLLSWRVKLSR